MYTYSFFFFNDTATTEIYTLSLHDALPIANCTPSCFSKYVFRTSFSAWQVSEPLGEWVSKKGEKEFFLCYSNYAFGTESANAFIEGLAKNGGKDTGKNTPALG